ncbi:MAG: hypothetical protein H8E89_10970 [Candidatus Nitrosopelagicus sp.]|nr:hypothetical protein [Candidatus Nitrosopelagicus sp.]
MNKLIFSGISCLILLFSVQMADAQEELPLPVGKNIKEWEAISAALVAEKRFNEAIIYLDKILDSEPDNLKALSNKAGLLIQLGKFLESVDISDKVLEMDKNRTSALINKSIALKMLGENEESFLTLSKILIVEPENEEVKKARANLLSLTPTVLLTSDSKYEVHASITIRDKNDNLIAVTESTNSRFLDSKFTESWWNDLGKMKYLKYDNGIEIFQKTNEVIVHEDHLGLVSLEKMIGKYTIQIFEVFVPMIQIEETDVVEITWTIVKK